MRVKFEATEAIDKVHKRSSISHIYSQCVVHARRRNPAGAPRGA